MYTNLLRELLYLCSTTAMSNRSIGHLFDIAHNTIGKYRRKAVKLGLDWSAIEQLSDLELERLIVGRRQRLNGKRQPDWNEVHRALQQKGMTLQLCWEEHCLAEPATAYSYSQYTQLYREYAARVDAIMRQPHPAGKCAFVDFSGKKLRYTDPKTGIQHEVEIFVGCLGCSNYTFVCATASQSSVDWVWAIDRMLQFFRGVPEGINSDNLKAAVIRAGSPRQLNRTYLELARYYGFVILATRVRHPRDNAKAEKAVQQAQRRILAVLRNRTFFSLQEVNDAIAELLPTLNARPFAKMPGSRLSWYQELDLPALKPLPSEPYIYAEWLAARKVPRDYHLRVDDHYYSVPSLLIGAYLETRLTANTVEFFQGGRRVASHLRSHVVNGRTTLREHQPPAHRQYADHTPEKYLEWAADVGPATLTVVKAQFEGREQSLLGLRACSDLKRLARDYGVERFEAACGRALDIGSPIVKSVRSILHRRIDTQSPRDHMHQTELPLHSNVRGRDYYSAR